ncbi:MAG TPA: DUF1553 domain-containing protein, partial [Planctomycetaceae bacterium]|nr:DUF1553 domain-containing protein [Planctomycetaceae bacterium]
EMSIRLTGSLACLLLLFGIFREGAAQDGVDFSREIRPVLAKRCFPCHGPGMQEAGLRLDRQESLLAKLESGSHAVVAGKPEESELISRISSTDESTRMPPEGKPLSEREISLFQQWIKAGAEWETHWSFQPVSRPEIPQIENTEWVRTPIDAFILKRLESAKIEPNPRAAKIQLLRRAYYSLTGLPPDRAEIEDFLAEESPQAFENVVDRLLASPQYGEKWARHWLDVVRFAETNSFERDSLKPHAWRFRDYVIRSFNEDKPYDQFVREQLAGDEIANPTPDSIIATGYYRLGLWDDEPADRLLAKYDALDDLVTTTGQAFLAMTINCARCHDHKIDPIEQTDYYSMVSFFQGITPMDKGGPNIERAIFEDEQAKRDYEEAVEQLNQERNRVQTEVRELEEEFKQKFKSLSLDQIQQPDLADLEYRFYRDTFEKLPNFDELKPETVAKLDPPYFDLRPATREDSFGFVFIGSLIVPADGEYTFWLDSDDGSRLTVDRAELIVYDGIHKIGKPHQKTVTLKQGRVPIRLDYFQGKSDKGLGVRWSGPGFQDRYLSAATEENVLISDLKSKPLPELIRATGRSVLGEKKNKIYNDKKQELGRLFSQKIPADYALCVTETPNPPETFLLQRGNPRLQGDPVEPSFPAVLTSVKAEIEPPPSDSNTSGRRLALANWIASPENKLTARVIVNRIWQHHFGRGIVQSSNNFGLLGAPPTHPELLDWLASDLMDHGWKLKRLHKMIVMSAVWQQSSAPNDASYEQDPANELFWKHDMQRLSAEEIRDSLYAVTGELNLKMYGPGVYPSIPAEILAGQSRPGDGWGNSSPEEQSRRAIYIHVKRSLITPLLSDFDFCDTDSSCAERFSTVQPTQALAMLNGDFLQERAVKLADRLRAESDILKEQIHRSIWYTVQRQPTENDLERGLSLVNQLKSEHKLPEAQALNLYCLMVLNLNEFLYLD